MKLSEYQNQIYKNNKNILELYEKNLVLKKEAAKSLKNKDEVTAKKLGAEVQQNSLKAAGIESSNINLASALEQRRSILDKKINDIIQKPVTKLGQKELSDAREEIEAHSKLAAQHKRELQKEAQAKKQKQEEIYKEEKTKLYKSASNFIGDPVSLNKILVPLAQKKGTKESVGLGDMASSGLSALGFAFKNIGSVIDVAGSASFYKEEAAKIPMGKGVKEEASFFLKLLDDPDSVEFLKANNTKLGNLVETIAPTLISIGIRELSKLPELQERLVVHEKQHGLLTGLEDKLKKLQTKLAPNEIDNQQIAEITEQIGNRKLLEQRIGIAKTVEALEKAGITAEYIQKKLLPIALNPLKEILKNPKDVIEVVNAGLDIFLEKDPKKTQESLQFIASKIDFGALIGSSGLQDFLVTESTNLAKIATIVMATNENVKTQVDKLGITPEIVQQVIPAVTQIASVALADTNKLTEVYKEIVISNTKISDITRQEKAQKEIDRSELTEEQIKELDARNEVLKKQKNEVLSEMVGSASKVVLQDNFLDSVRSNVSGLLDKNQVAITKMVTHNLGQLGEESLPRQILTGVSPEFAKNTTAVVTGLVSTVLKETSNEQIQSLVASGQSLLTASKEERAKVVQDLAGQGMTILNNENIAKSIGQVGQLLTSEKEQVQLIVNNALKTDPAKEQLVKFGVDPAMVQGLVPLVTEIGAELLSEANIKKIPELYGAFTKFTGSASKEKAQKEIDRSNLSEEQIKVLEEQTKELGKQKNVALSKLIGSATDVVLQDNVLDSVRSNVSGLLDKNQVAITKMVTHNLGQLGEESLPRQILTGVSPEFAKNTTAAVTGLVSTVLKETSNEQIQSLVASGQSLLTASKEERAKVVQDLAGQGMAILGNSQVADSLQNVGTTLVNSSADISKIAFNALANSPLKGVITKEQIQDAVPIVTKTVGAVLNSSQDIVTIATKSQELLSGLDKTTKGLTPKQAGSFGTIIESLSNIVNQPRITGALTKDLPEFLQKNKDNIPDIASNIVKNIPALSTLTKEMGVSDDLIRDSAKLGTDLLIDAAPMVDKFARATLKEKDQLVTIISDVRDLANAPKENQKEAVLKVVSNIIALKESNQDLKDIFDKELPNLLEKNQEQLAKVIDGVIHTKAGPGLKLKTEKIIKVVADNLPAVTKIADLYSKGKYAAMFPEIVKLAFKKNVLSTAIGTLSRIRKHNAEKKKEDVANVVEETIKKDVDKDPSELSSKKKDSQTVSVGTSKKTSTNIVPERSDLEHLEHIRGKMDKHVSTSDRSSTIISKDKHKKLKSQHKIN